MVAVDDRRDMASPGGQLPENEVLAANLREYANLLAQQGADGFKVAAYRRAAEVIAALDRPLSDIFATRGSEGLTALPGVGRAIAAALAEMVSTGHWSQLARLRGTPEPEKLFRTIPCVGPELARRAHDELHIDTLEALEMAAHDGRLAKVPGFGERRLELIRTALAERLGRPRLRELRDRRERPSVGLLLDVDREYREKARAGALPKIAPKRFNPTGEAWLPILHTLRDGCDFTALYSNTRLAHELGRSRDWVIIYYEADTLPEGQCTVVTETHGPSMGLRVVRGREGECLDLWRREHPAKPRPVEQAASGMIIS
jgi:hypothetical protein